MSDSQNTRQAPRTLLAFVAISALQALVAWLAPVDVLARYPALNDFVELVRSIAPAVGNYDNCNAAPEIMRLLMTMMITLIPLQVWVFWRWLHASKHDNYRHFVVSPSTEESPASSLDFIRDANPNPATPRKTVMYSFVRKLIFYLLLALILAGAFSILLKYSNLTTVRRSTFLSYGCRTDPVFAWFGLSPFYWLLSFLIAVFAATTRDFAAKLISWRAKP
ncbi:MAG: hypothetical protein ACREUW_18625 [Burkholderiales bacterium]